MDRYFETKKKFFTSGMTTASGEQVTTDAVRERIRAMIDDEDAEHPLSDEKISATLKSEGFPVARRTVAKYRSELGIPGTSERRAAGRSGLARAAKGVALACLLSAWGLPAGADTVPAWRNAVDACAAEEAMRAYTSDVVRCEWAGENPGVSGLMPANIPFQFAVAGDADVTNRVQRILRDTADAIRPEVRNGLARLGLLNSTLQWMVRLCRPGVTNEATYLSVRAHPAVFAESDFDAEKLKAVASRFTGAAVPLPVRLTVGYADEMAPLGRATPAVDYPDFMPEETFNHPFGCAFVVRAPERRRKIRISADTYPVGGMASNFIWRTTGSGRLYPWSSAFRDEPRAGHADFVFNTTAGGVRWDVLVFAQLPNGMIGPPSIVSIYNPPLMQRKYVKGRLQSISYVGKAPRFLPYDIDPIWTPHEWKDEYTLDRKGRIVSFTRTFPGKLEEQTISAVGELVESMSPSGFPLSARKVEYFESPETGRLEYRPVGPEIKYRLGTSPYRRSGE